LAVANDDIQPRAGHYKGSTSGHGQVEFSLFPNGVIKNFKFRDNTVHIPHTELNGHHKFHFEKSRMTFDRHAAGDLMAHGVWEKDGLVRGDLRYYSNKHNPDTNHYYTWEAHLVH